MSYKAIFEQKEKKKTDRTTSIVVIASQEYEKLAPLNKTRPPMLFNIAGKKIIEWFLDYATTLEAELIIISDQKDAKAISSFLENNQGNQKKVPIKLYAELAKDGLTKEFIEYLVKEQLLAKTIWCDGNIIFSPAILPSFDTKGEAQLFVNEQNDSAGLAVVSKEFMQKGKLTPKTTTVGELTKDGTKKKLTTEQAQLFWQLKYPWNLLDANQALIKEITRTISGTIEENVTIIGEVIVKEGARIRSGSYLEGPLVIGKDCDIGPNCYLRKGVSLEKEVRVGNACEMKNTIVFEGTHIAHLSYVGDSIVGANCNFGAGTITGNLRLDDKTVKAATGEKVVSTGRRKIGVIMGDNVKTAINTFFMPGVIVGNNSAIGAGVVLHRNLAANTFIYQEQKTVTQEWKPPVKKKKKK